MEVVEQGGMTVAGVLVQAPWQRLWDEVPKAWQQVFQRAPELQALQQGPFMDVSLGLVDSAYLQLVGVRLREGAAVPRGFTAVHIPAQKLLRHRHVGPAAGIADSFGAMYAWARRHGVALGDFKLDFGYLPSGDETEHELLAGLLPEVAWRPAQSA